MEDTLAFYGSEVKALGGGRIGGYGILFTSPDDPDLQSEFFTKSTDYFIDQGDKRPVLYRHGMSAQLKSRNLGRAEVTRIDDVGVFFEGELNLRDNYEKAVYKLAEMGKLGYSTGAMGHLVSKRPVEGKKSVEIIAWPVGELSLTPNPVEARTSAFSLKSMAVEEIDLDAFIKSQEEPKEPDTPFDIAGIPAIAKFCENVSPNSLKDASQRSESAADAAREFITIANVLGEAYHTYKDRLVRRAENRFLKDNREIDPSTAAQVDGLLADMDRILPAFNSIKESLQGLHKISEMSKAEQKAMTEKAKLAVWNYHRISGTLPEELDNGNSAS